MFGNSRNECNRMSPRTRIDTPGRLIVEIAPAVVLSAIVPLWDLNKQPSHEEQPRTIDPHATERRQLTPATTRLLGLTRLLRFCSGCAPDGGRHSPGDRVAICGCDRASGVPDAVEGKPLAASHPHPHLPLPDRGALGRCLACPLSHTAPRRRSAPARAVRSSFVGNVRVCGGRQDLER